ncbi:hypothetical protein K474DRAFT_1703661 [Panus rudis PR-1116 ss-1]|nr:hypothetical protein K474DRAFT_1703661 [Panus rudis PR-1116 ss-1]
MTVGTFITTLERGEGFHTTLATKYAGKVVPNCSLRLIYDFPPDVYVDLYELKYDNIGSFKYHPIPSLELPVQVAGENYTHLHVDLGEVTQTPLIVRIPVHARYALPVWNSDNALRPIRLPAPTGHWHCPSDDAMAVPKTIACTSQLEQSSSKEDVAHGHLTFEIPAGIRDDLDTVEFSTNLLVLSMLAYLMYVYTATTKRLYGAKSSGAKSKKE